MREHPQHSASSEPAVSPCFCERSDGDLPCRLLVPDARRHPPPWPLILFLHGAGERGADNKAQLLNAVHVLARPHIMDAFPCVVIAPQCPEEERWVDVDWDAPSHELPDQPSRPMAAAMQILNAVMREVRIAPDQVYVAGISMGGFGTWDALMRYPQVFAAGIPVCGGADDSQAARIAGIPVWAFHGGLDDAVRPARSRSIIAALRAAGGHPKYTEYPNAGHDSWTPAFDEPMLLPWLLAQRRSERQPDP